MAKKSRRKAAFKLSGPAGVGGVPTLPHPVRLAMVRSGGGKS
jgi:hypothetical protein